jgi:hypothetical protein
MPPTAPPSALALSAPATPCVATVLKLFAFVAGSDEDVLIMWKIEDGVRRSGSDG